MGCEVMFELPEWMIDIPMEEYFAIVNSCKASAKSAFYAKLDKIYEKRQARLAAERAGQMSIYDYA